MVRTVTVLTSPTRVTDIGRPVPDVVHLYSQIDRIEMSCTISLMACLEVLCTFVRKALVVLDRAEYDFEKP